MSAATHTSSAPATLAKGPVGAKKAAKLPSNLSQSAVTPAVVGSKRKSPPGSPEQTPRTPSPPATTKKLERKPKSIGTFVPVCPDDFVEAARMIGVDYKPGKGAKLIVRKVTPKDPNKNPYYVWDQHESVRYITFGNGKHQPVPIYYAGIKMVKDKPTDKMGCKAQISPSDFDNLQKWRHVWYRILWETGQEDTDTPMDIDVNWKKQISDEVTPQDWVAQVKDKYKNWRKKALKSKNPEEKQAAQLHPTEFPTDWNEVVQLHDHEAMRHKKGNWLWADRVKISGSGKHHFAFDFDLKTTGDYPKPQHLLQAQRGGKPPKNYPIRDLLPNQEFGKLRVQQKFGLYDGGAVANFGVIHERWGRPTTYLTPAKGTKYEKYEDMTPAQKKQRKEEQSEKARQEMINEFAACAEAYDSSEEYGTSYD